MGDVTSESASVSSPKSASLPSPQCRVAQVIVASGLAKGEFANAIGIDATSLSRILGGGTLSERVALRIEGVFGDRALWLLTGEDQYDKCHACEGQAAYTAQPRGAPIRRAVYDCWRCRGDVHYGAHLCPHCGAQLIWQNFHERAGDLAHAQ